jgi:hypothetical protein
MEGIEALFASLSKEGDFNDMAYPIGGNTECFGFIVRNRT